jgi:hypothetical protein
MLENLKSRLSQWTVIATLVMHRVKLSDATKDCRLWATLGTRFESARKLFGDQISDFCARKARLWSYMKANGFGRTTSPLRCWTHIRLYREMHKLSERGPHVLLNSTGMPQRWARRRHATLLHGVKRSFQKTKTTGI